MDTGVHRHTDCHEGSHMANRQNLIYNTGSMHIDTSLHMATNTPNMDNHRHRISPMK